MLRVTSCRQVLLPPAGKPAESSISRSIYSRQEIWDDKQMQTVCRLTFSTHGSRFLPVNFPMSGEVLTGSGKFSTPCTPARVTVHKGTFRKKKVKLVVEAVSVDRNDSVA